MLFMAVVHSLCIILFDNRNKLQDGSDVLQDGSDVRSAAGWVRRVFYGLHPFLQ